MLHGLKDNLEANYRQKILRLRDEELQLVVKQLNAAQILFTLLAGIMTDAMWTGYYMYNVREAIAAPGGPDTWLEFLVAGSVYLSIFLPLASVFGSTVLTLYGPRRALCGRPEEFSSTVDALQAEFVWVPRLLAGCMCSAFVTIATWSWCTLAIYDDEPPNNAAGAIAVTLMACVLGCACYMTFIITFRRFNGQQQDFVSAKWFAAGGSFASSEPPNAHVAPGEGAKRASYYRLGEEPPAPELPKDTPEGWRPDGEDCSLGERGALGSAHAPAEERCEGAGGACSLPATNSTARADKEEPLKLNQIGRTSAMQSLVRASTEAGRLSSKSLIGMAEEEQRALDELRRSMSATELL